MDPTTPPTPESAAHERSVSPVAPASVSDEVAIQITGVDKWFGQSHVLRDVSLTVYRGERVVICGGSGSGKSTLIRCINRLETHQRGSIFIDGAELTDDLRRIQDVRREVGMVFPNFNLFPHLTVLENCTLAPIWELKTPKREAEEIASRTLERLGMLEHANAHPQSLSGGAQQRVSIARALCMNPRIMLFDEPTAALDPEMVRDVLDAIADVAEMGLTLICVTHELAFARQVATNVVFMDEGMVVEQGPPLEFFARPQDERTRRFLNQFGDLF